jgi:hypothetical protein
MAQPPLPENRSTLVPSHLFPATPLSARTAGSSNNLGLSQTSPPRPSPPRTPEERAALQRYMKSLEEWQSGQGTSNSASWQARGSAAQQPYVNVNEGVAAQTPNARPFSTSYISDDARASERPQSWMDARSMANSRSSWPDSSKAKKPVKKNCLYALVCFCVHAPV